MHNIQRLSSKWKVIFPLVQVAGRARRHIQQTDRKGKVGQNGIATDQPQSYESCKFATVRCTETNFSICNKNANLQTHGPQQLANSITGAQVEKDIQCRNCLSRYAKAKVHNAKLWKLRSMRNHSIANLRVTPNVRIWTKAFIANPQSRTRLHIWLTKYYPQQI